MLGAVGAGRKLLKGLCKEGTMGNTLPQKGILTKKGVRLMDVLGTGILNNSNLQGFCEGFQDSILRWANTCFILRERDLFSVMGWVFPGF